MQLNLANANKPIEVIPLGINWWGYKVYVAKSGLKLAGYTPNGNGPTNWMYHQVLEAVAVFASHGNSGHSAP